MTWIKERLAKVAEDYFKILEYEGYRPEGCSGNELADILIEELGLTEQSATYEDYEVKSVSGGEGIFRCSGMTMTSLGRVTDRWMVSRKERA